MRGTRAAKRKRQYRARQKRRSKAVHARFLSYLDRTEPEVNVYRRLARVWTWQVHRSLNKMTQEFKWIEQPVPGAASGVTLDNSPQGGTEPVIPVSAETGGR